MSQWIADSFSPPKSTIRLPPEPNVVSSVPFVRRRTTQNEPPAAPPPATTIRPLDWTSTTRAASVPPKLTVFLPPLPKLVSSAPGFAMRRPYRRAWTAWESGLGEGAVQLVT